MPKANPRLREQIMRVMYFEQADTENLIKKTGIKQAHLYRLAAELSETLLLTGTVPAGKGGFKGLQSSLRYDEHRRCAKAAAIINQLGVLKDHEIARIIAIVRMIRDKEKITKEEIVNELSFIGYFSDDGMPDESNEYATYRRDYGDLRTISDSLETLVNGGWLTEIKTEKVVSYALNDRLNGLDTPTLEALWHYVYHLANTENLTATAQNCGDVIADALAARDVQTQPQCEYRYNHIGRVFGDRSVAEMINAQTGNYVLAVRYRSVQTGSEEQLDVFPLQVVFDNDLCRWFAVVAAFGNGKTHELRTISLDGIVDAQLSKKVISAETALELRQQVGQQLSKAWLVSLEQPVEVQARFYFTLGKSKKNFILQRVQREKRWGVISALENPDYFDFAITVNGIHEIKPWLLSFGSAVEVLEPPELREYMISVWRLAATEAV